MKIQITETIASKILSLDDRYIATWAKEVDTMTIIIPYALDIAFQKGRESNEEGNYKRYWE